MKVEDLVQIKLVLAESGLGEVWRDCFCSTIINESWRETNMVNQAEESSTSRN